MGPFEFFTKQGGERDRRKGPIFATIEITIILGSLVSFSPGGRGPVSLVKLAPAIWLDLKEKKAAYRKRTINLLKNGGETCGGEEQTVH